eukprot:GHVU01084172.1.p2 GENE.GHVU01084172.1~~GHVU01084172.1.p2  ORF type:complete len:114 (+),score=7.29 GHVU01084172.1:448-789(+)
MGSMKSAETDRQGPVLPEGRRRGRGLHPPSGLTQLRVSREPFELCPEAVEERQLPGRMITHTGAYVLPMPMSEGGPHNDGVRTNLNPWEVNGWGCDANPKRTSLELLERGSGM